MLNSRLWLNLTPPFRRRPIRRGHCIKRLNGAAFWVNFFGFVYIFCSSYHKQLLLQAIEKKAVHVIRLSLFYSGLFCLYLLFVILTLYFADELGHLCQYKNTDMKLWCEVFPLPFLFLFILPLWFLRSDLRQPGTLGVLSRMNLRRILVKNRHTNIILSCSTIYYRFHQLVSRLAPCFLHEQKPP